MKRKKLSCEEIIDVKKKKSYFKFNSINSNLIYDFAHI